MLEWFLTFLLLLIVIVLFIQYSRLKGRVEARARELFELWKSKEIDSVRKSLEEKLRVEFEKWKAEETERIREDAIKRSASTIIGKVGEQLAPLIIFSNYGINPKDLRFLGSPVDFIAFKGLSEGKPEEVVFIEVKYGKTAELSEREKGVKELIEGKRVKWMLIHIPSEIEKWSKSLRTSQPT